MTNRPYLPGQFAFATAVLAVAIMTGCTQTQQQAPPAASPPPTQKVFVIFDGPWGFAPDPKDANFVIAMAPNTNEHHPLYVKASYYQELTSGVYDLSMPPRTVAPNGTVISDIVPAKVDPKNVQRILDDKLQHRYAIRLPKPEMYTPDARYPSRVGTDPPPKSKDAPTKPWATAVSLQYSVASLNTFQLAGNPDTGTFQPLPLQVDTPEISFVIHPSHDDTSDQCHTHARRAFHDLTALLGVTLYVDFPDSPSSCLDKDPQKPGPAKALVVPPGLAERLLASVAVGEFGAEEASVAPTPPLIGLISVPLKRMTRQAISALYLFAQPSGGCKSPIINGG